MKIPRYVCSKHWDFLNLIIMNIKKNIAISDSGFIFNPETGESYTANIVAIRLLELIKEGKDKGEIFESILEEYDIDQDTFEKDYHDFVSMLQRFQLTQDHE